MSLAASPGGTKQEAPGRELAMADPAALLAWYDRHRRRLPWRAQPGAPVDPYRVWLSEIMLQQTTVKTVTPYFQRFVTRWPDVSALAAARLDDVLREWAGLGYYARARNLHACAQTVAQQHGGRFPDSEAALRALPGVGDYTAAAIAAIAFGRRTTPVDGNIERVIARLFAVTEELPAAKSRIRTLAEGLTPDRGAGDFAQAMMDLGATICTPRKPACALCPWMFACAARRSGDAETFPRKRPKGKGELRRGAAFWIMRDDACVLIRTRAARGLLGGMAEMPGSEWSRDFEPRRGRRGAPNLTRFDGRKVRLNWRRLPGTVTHVFTHFPLELFVYAVAVPKDTAAPGNMRWTPVAQLGDEALPTLMRKVIAHAMGGRR